MPEPLSDRAAAAMVEVLQRHRVAFVLIGGFAIQLHGVGTRHSEVMQRSEELRAFVAPFLAEERQDAASG